MTAAVFLFLFLFAGFLAFDLLVSREYTVHREQWVRDGRPFGIMWRPRAADRTGSASAHLAKLRVQFVWLFRTPQWVSGDAAARRLLWLLRVSALVWNAGVVVVAFTA